MKQNKTNLQWVANLPEVGLPIRNRAEEIAWRLEKANRALADARAAHRAATHFVAQEAKDLESLIAGLWAPNEIAAAKGLL